MQPSGIVAGSLQEVWRYPVKGMMGEELRSCWVGPSGLSFDHFLAVADKNGRIIDAKRVKGSRLLTCSAEVLDGNTDLPAMFWVQVRGDAAAMGWEEDPCSAAWLANALSRLLEEEGVRMVWNSEVKAPRVTTSNLTLPETSFVDAAPVHILTSSAIAEAEAAGFTQIVQRARPQLVVKTDRHYTGMPESDWVGRCVRIGSEVILNVTGPTGRCSQLWQGQHMMPPEKGFLGWAKRELGGNFGVYAEVIHPGIVSVRDRVVLLDV